MNWRYRAPISLFVFTGALGFVLFLSSFWVPAKALLAQILLEKSWHHYQKTGEFRRPWPWADHHPVGQIEAPVQRVKQIFLANDKGSSLAFAPALNQSSGKAGSALIISGHRDTHFRFLKFLKTNDPIMINFSSRRKIFKVVGSEVIDSRKNKLSPERFPGGLVLVTCYPFDAPAAGGPLRYVVFARSV